jgi:hypothetical protein
MKNAQKLQTRIEEKLPQVLKTCCFIEKSGKLIPLDEGVRVKVDQLRKS